MCGVVLAHGGLFRSLGSFIIGALFGSGLALGGSLHLNGKALAGILNGGISLVHAPGKGVNAFGSFLTQFYLRHGGVELVFAFLKGADSFAQAELRQRHTLAPGGTGGWAAWVPVAEMLFWIWSPTPLKACCTWALVRAAAACSWALMVSFKARSK